MGKLSEMTTAIEELRTAVAAINEIANWLAQQFGSTADTEAKTELTFEQVRTVLAEKSRAGHTAAIRELLRKYGADCLSDVKPAYYTALVKEAEGIVNG